MSGNSFNNDDDSRRLNKNDIAQVFHGIQEDFNMLTVENIDVATMFVDKQTINSLVKMAEAINAEISSAEEFYSALGVRDTVSTTAFVKFLHSLESDIAKVIETFEDITVFASENGEKVTARKFFTTFIRTS